MLNLATAWVRGHGAAEASPLSGYWIQHVPIGSSAINYICRIILTTTRMFNIMKTFFKCLILSGPKHDGLKQKFNESLLNNFKESGTDVKYETKKKKESIFFNLFLLYFLNLLSKAGH